MKEMKKMRKFEKVSFNDLGILPTRNDKGSAGYDLYLPCDIEILPNAFSQVALNIKAQMEKDEVLKIYVRSSIGIKKHLMLANGTGIIDSTYYNNPDNEGNIIVVLYNYGRETVRLKKGDRIAQGVFVKYLTTEDDKPLNEERIGGIGSSGN